MSDAHRTGQRRRRIGSGMVIGVLACAALGLGVGSFFFDKAGWGVVFGIGVGVAVGVALIYGNANRVSEDPDEPAPGQAPLDRSAAGLEEVDLADLIDDAPGDPPRRRGARSAG